MHTIGKRQGRWQVLFVEAHAEPGYRAQADVIATCGTAHWAAIACSWLNGGEAPSLYDNTVDIVWE